jgi:adenylate cyclase
MTSYSISENLLLMILIPVGLIALVAVAIAVRQALLLVEAKKFLGKTVYQLIRRRRQSLYGKSYEMTAFTVNFTGLSAISEMLSPMEMVFWLDRCLIVMIDCIDEFGGTITQLGGRIECFWNAMEDQPDHAIRACKCALRMLEIAQILNSSNPPHMCLAPQVGISTGMAFIGNIGSPSHMQFMAFGDNVELANRLAYSNAVYSTKVLMNQEAYNNVKGTMITREIDRILLKGKAEPAFIYELLSANQ